MWDRYSDTSRLIVLGSFRDVQKALCIALRDKKSEIPVTETQPQSSKNKLDINDSDQVREEIDKKPEVVMKADKDVTVKKSSVQNVTTNFKVKKN